MRSELVGELNRAEVFSKLNEFLPVNAQIQLHEKKNKNIIVFVTKEYHCIGDLLVRHQFGELKANIQAIISNHDYLKEFCEKREISCLYMLPFFKEYTKNNPGELTHYPLDGHWNKTGTNLAAEFLLENIEDYFLTK